MNSSAYEKLFRDLGFTQIQRGRLLSHPSVVATVYFNCKRNGETYFTGQAKNKDKFPSDLWQRLPPKQKKDDKPGLITVVPVEGKEREAFQALLRGRSRAFTHYWSNATWDSLVELEIDHTASEMFLDRGVDDGARLFIVTIKNGQLFLGSRLLVDRVVGLAKARKIFGPDVWEAKDHVIARKAQPFRRDLRVPTEVVRELSFIGKNPRLVMKKGRLDQQTLRGVRELTDESALLLEGLLQAAETKTPGARKLASAGSGHVSKEWRSDSEAARAVFGKVFESIAPGDRRRWEVFLSDSIAYAAERYPDRWGISLFPEFLRFNVGQTESIVIYPLVALHVKPDKMPELERETFTA
jgi:hypothetical protein